MTDSFFDKQARILSFIQQTRSILHTIHDSHISEKFILMYPRSFASSSDGKHSRGQSLSRTMKTGDLRVLALPDELSFREGEMEESTMSRMMGSRLGECIAYLERLYSRVGDKTSRVLVTGDVNAGKSTFVNALLRTDLLPTDQQPCTQCFCEVISSQNSHGRDDFCVHAMTDYSLYDLNNAKTFDRLKIPEMQECIQDEATKYQLFRVFLNDECNILSQSSQIEVSLIDSPGLNSDLFKTMSLFSKQEDIDVIVFLINAANHLTLSAREFLDTASQEKAYIFIVVNKFDDIKNQEKCKRIVLSQIQEVLPKTYEERAELIHFISAGQYFKQIVLSHSLSSTELSFPSPKSATSIETRGITSEFKIQEDFGAMENCLRNFIMEKRTKSKLLPAQTYLKLLINEVLCVLDYNKKKRSEELNKLQHELDIIAPCYEELMAHHGIIQADLRRTAEEVSESIYLKTKSHFSSFNKIELIIGETRWGGMFRIWNFSDSVRRRFRDETLLWMKQARLLTVTNTCEGIQLLNGIATAHAKQVFSSLPNQDDYKVKVIFPDPEGILVPITDFSILDMLDLSLFMRGSTWLSAMTIAGATFGYQPLFSLALRILDLSQSAGKFVTISVVVAAGGAAMMALLGDLESIVKSKLTAHYKGFIESTHWTNEPARLLRDHAKVLLNKHQNSLVSRFEAALHQQRQLRAEKDLMKFQTETTVTYLDLQLHNTQNLLLALRQYNM